MDRTEIVRLLTELGRRLAARGLNGDMYVVGGAAIALAFDARRVTRDIDAVFEPKIEIYKEAGDMARDEGLPDGWLNDAVKSFLAAPDEAAAVALDLPGLRVSTASARALLALKVLAHRVGEDEEDVRLLARELHLSTADEVLAAAEATFGDRLEPAARFFVEELFA